MTGGRARVGDVVDGQGDGRPPAVLPDGTCGRFRRVAVVGAGLMGRRLAGTFASGGLDVVVTDTRTELLEEAGRDARVVANERATSAGTVWTAAALAETLEGVDLVTEAVTEDLDLKRRLFVEMAALNPTAVLASNSSVLPISAIAAEVEDGGRTIGTHWWNPPDLIPVVEVIPSERTDPQVVADIVALLRALGKDPVWVQRECPGFIGNRLQHALWREAIALVAEGVADAETVDLVARNTIGLRLAEMGPLENADYIGLDLTRAIHEAVFPALSRAVEPSSLLDDLLAAGHRGAGSGQGFLRWSAEARGAAGASLAAHVRAGLVRRSEEGNRR